MLLTHAPTMVDTILLGAGCLTFGVLFIYLGIEGVEKLVRS